MKLVKKSHANQTLLLIISGAIALTGVVYAAIVILSASSPVSAASKSDWIAGDIISDEAFTNKDSMSVADIQSFLDNRINCDIWGTSRASEYGSSLTRAQYAASRGWAGPPYTCLNKYYEVPKTVAGGNMPANNYSSPDVIPSGAQSAAWIIKDAANRYNISPKVLLVKIATESVGPLTSDNWPLFSQYRYAMGSHCPDSGPNGSANCDPAYAGFSIQMYSAASLMRWYLDSMDQPWWTYKKPGNNHILWNVVERGCGGSNVTIQNKATAALYTYTPYQPNAAALDNMYGTGDNCSAYGNRNFWRVYWDWFGPTRFTIFGGILEEYNRFGGHGRLGNPIMNEYCGLKGGACFQDFQNGSLYWTPSTNRAYTLIGGMKERWDSLGKEWGALGYPMSGEIYSNDGVSQRFENGVLISGNGGKLFVVLNRMEKDKHSYLGQPKEDTICGIKNNGCYQTFNIGTLYQSSATGSYSVIGGIKERWDSLGKEWGSLGLPTSGEIYNRDGVSQRFENGMITTGSDGRLYSVLSRMKHSSDHASIGLPRENTSCGTKHGGCYQSFANGVIYQSNPTGAHRIIGGIKDKWDSLGKEWGILGYPTSSEYTENGLATQRFEGGKIVWTNNGAQVTRN